MGSNSKHLCDFGHSPAKATQTTDVKVSPAGTKEAEKRIRAPPLRLDSYLLVEFSKVLSRKTTRKHFWVCNYWSDFYFNLIEGVTSRNQLDKSYSFFNHSATSLGRLNDAHG